MPRESEARTGELWGMRHGPVTDAVRGRLYGRLDVPLHPAGREQMRRAARDFLRLRQALYGAERLPVRVVSSPLARCRESASHVLAVLRAAGEEVLLTLDELETLRLIDLEGLQQEQAALEMGVARTTVQAIYNAARKKVADCIVNGKALRIGGGDVEVCAGRKDCRRARCPHRCGAPCGREEKEEA